MNSYSELQALGSGVLEIDALVPTCRFNGESIQELSIAQELHAWLKGDLQAHSIPSAQVEQAVLLVNLELRKSLVRSSPRGSFYIGKNGMPIEKGEFFNLAVQCKSTIKTDEAQYHSERTHHEQWPVGWPET